MVWFARPSVGRCFAVRRKVWDPFIVNENLKKKLIFAFALARESVCAYYKGNNRVRDGSLVVNRSGI